ncbi:MAG: UDP-glucose dehydrogenase family protein [Gemmatimonadaceae bacterium]
MKVAVIGTGYVGLTSGVGLASLGHHVTCVDVSQERLRVIREGRAPFHEPGLPELLTQVLGDRRLQVTDGVRRAVADCEVVFITVGTPDGPDGIDLSFVVRAASDIGAALRGTTEYRVVVVKSTVVPGTTDGPVRRAIEEASGMAAGAFGLCMNPEFLREGAAVGDFLHPDRIVVGAWDARSATVLAKLYESVDCPKVFTSLRNAEMVKYASNALLATLVSFSNEIASLCESTPDTDVEVVLRGVHLDRRLAPIVDGKRIRPGIADFVWAGAGFGGSCLPKDVNALRAYARGRAIEPHILDAVVAVNSARPGRLCAMLEQAVGSLRGARVALFGLAFKPGTDDVRDSPALAAARVLAAGGASITAFDPLIRQAPAGSDWGDLMTVCDTPAEALTGADAALITTAWSEFAGLDWNALCALMHRRIVVDGRNILRGVTWPPDTRYLGIGGVHEHGRSEGHA